MPLSALQVLALVAIVVISAILGAVVWHRLLVSGIKRLVVVDWAIVRCDDPSCTNRHMAMRLAAPFGGQFDAVFQLARSAPRSLADAAARAPEEAKEDRP